MIKLLIKNFFRSKGSRIGLWLLFFSGLISLYIGNQFLERSQKVLDKTSAYQSKSIQGYVEHSTGELGLLLYYIRFGISNELSNLAGLSIGLRDVNPAVHSVTIRNLEEQKYASELLNPMYQMLGNLDFSFVLIFLFPLIIIGFGFNLISEEKEEGTWSLVKSQSAKPVKMLFAKIAIRFVSVLTVLIALLLIAFFYLNLSFNSPFIAFASMAILYLVFWFSVVWLVMSFQKSSSQSALILLLVWVFLTVLVPASVNVISTHKYPIPETFATLLKSREGYHNKWDQSLESTMKKFHEQYPQFSEYKHPEGVPFSWIWYYAMQQMGDNEAAEAAKQVKEKLKKRSDFGNTLAAIFPTMHTQLSLNSLAQTDLENYIKFIKALEEFHEEKKMEYFPAIFKGRTVSEQDWSSIDIVKYRGDQSIGWLRLFLPLILISLVCVIIAQTKFSKL